MIPGVLYFAIYTYKMSCDSTSPSYDTQYLINIIREMSDKIDNLENKIDYLLDEIHQTSSRRGGVARSGWGERSGGGSMIVPDYTPSIHFQQWIQNFDIDKQDVTNVLETNILDGFKDCILKYFTQNASNPISNIPYIAIVRGNYKCIYIYDCLLSEEQNSGLNDASSVLQWRIITDDDIYMLICVIWSKMLEYYFVIEEEELMADELSDREQLQRDINKKVLLDMKTRLQKHIKDIKRWILEA